MILPLLVAALAGIQSPVYFDGRESALEGHTAAVRYLAFPSDPAKGTLVSATDGEAIVWQLSSQKSLKQIEVAGPTALSADGSRLALANLDQVTILNASSFESVKIIENSSELGFANSDIICSLAFSKDGTKLAVGGYQDLLVVYTMGSGPAPAGESRPIRLLQGPADCTALSPDGKLLATGNTDGTVSIFNSADGSLVKTIESFGKTVSCIAFSSDGKSLAAGSEDHAVKLWTVPEWKQIMDISHKGIVFGLAFSADSKLIATASNAGDRKSAVEIFDAATGKSVAKKAALDYWVFALAFSPDGKSLAGGGEDQLVRIWPLSR
ncbi:MAG: WD40 repeat domain-containing protein [Fimbriimonadales bacterium]